MKKIVFLLLMLSPLWVMAEDRALSPQAMDIKLELLETYSETLQYMGFPEEISKQSLQEDIAQYGNEERELLAQDYKGQFLQIKSSINRLDNPDERILLEILMDKCIRDLSAAKTTEEEYEQVKDHVKTLSRLTKGPLKESSTAHFILGALYGTLMSYEGGAAFITRGPKSAKAYEEAYELNPSEYSALFGIAMSHLYAPPAFGGDVREAERKLRIILSNSPYQHERFFALAFLGVTKELEGDRSAAMEYWQQADNLYPGQYASKFIQLSRMNYDPLILAGLEDK